MPIPTTRREVLRDLKADNYKNANAGLWLDKYLNKPLRKEGEEGEKDNKAKTQLVKEVACIKVSPIYEKFYERWEQLLVDCDAVKCEIRVSGRMAVGLGADGVLETSITLHRTYGVPYIPGSALKGLALRYAWNRLEKSGGEWTKEHTQILFGCDEKGKEAAGYVTFFDALYVPNTGHKVNGISYPLRPDVMTVHHADYYQDGTKPPADWDDPTPVSFISATGEYLLAVAAPDALEWREIALTILEKALADEGIGAKTSSGYGRMRS